jgi:hypothetical protein
MAKDPGQADPQAVRGLVRDVVVELAGSRLPVGEHGPALHRHVGVAVLREALLDHVCGSGEGRVGVAVPVAAAEHDVAAVLREQQRRFGRERGIHVDDGIERVDVDLDQRGRIFGDRPGVGDDDRDRFAHQTDGVARQRAVGRREQTVTARRHHVVGDVAQIGIGQHEVHTGHMARGRDVDGGDPPVGDRAANERGVEHPRHGQVIDVAALPGEDPRILRTAHARAREARHH